MMEITLKRADGQPVSLAHQQSAGRLQFSLPDLQTIEKQNAWGTTTVVFDQRLTGGVALENFSLPLEEARYQLYTRAGALDLRLRLPADAGAPAPNRKKLFPWGIALGLHALVAIVAVLLSHQPDWWKPDAPEGQEVAEVSEEAPAPESSGNSAPVVSNRVAFSGFSLWKLLQANAPKPTKEQRLSSLLDAELGQAVTVARVGTPGGGGKASNLPGFSIGKHASLNVDRAASGAGVPAVAAAPQLSAAERAKAETELKNKMDQAQKEMRGFYSEALRKDPSFNTRVTVTAKISPDGKLSDIKSTPQGHNAAQSALASDLSASIKTLLTKLSVPAALSGSSVRREFIFWK